MALGKKRRRPSERLLLAVTAIPWQSGRHGSSGAYLLA